MYPYIKILNMSIPTYGLCMCAAIFLCVILALKKGQTKNIGFDDLIIVVAISMGCSMLGGTFLYIFITYDFIALYNQITSGELLFLKNPGTVFYGGLLTGLFGGIITAKTLKIRIESIESSVIPYIPLGHAIGRIGCLLAGCCYGFPYNGIFAVSTRFDLGHSTYFPIQAIEALFNLIILGVLLFYTKKERFKYSIVALYLIMYSFLRFCLEFFRGDVIRGRFLLFSTSQWISLMVFFFSLMVMLKNNKNRKCT